MTHASVELVEAMAGVAPFKTSPASTVASLSRACDRVEDFGENCPIPAFAWDVKRKCIDTTRSAHEVTCPRCLVAQDAAREGRVLTP